MKQFFPRKEQKPKEMVIYLCSHCNMDSGRSNLESPFCYYCERSDSLVEICREPLTPDVMANRIEECANRMMENLRNAYDIKKEDWPDSPEEEMQLLEALAEGKDVQRAIQEVTSKLRNNR